MSLNIQMKKNGRINPVYKQPEEERQCSKCGGKQYQEFWF